MLGQPYSMLLPEVIGFKLTGKLKEGVTATDLVLTVTQMLRKHGVVGKFVEFFGPGLANLSIADRATIGNMAPEYGATCGFFPVDDETIDYLTDTGRPAARVALVAAYAKAQGMYRTQVDARSGLHRRAQARSVAGRAVARRPEAPAGPRRAQGREGRLRHRDGEGVQQGRRRRQGHLRSASVARTSVDKNFAKAGCPKRVPVEGRNHDLGHGDVVIAAITSCTNTSNPSVMIGAGLLARKAVAKGLTVKPWVKTSLAPGSQVVAEYLDKSGLQKDLDKLGFNLVGFGCTTCIGNSGPLPPEISKSDQRQRSGRRRGAVGQPQLRRPRQRRRAGELSRLAAAGRRLCARRLDVVDLVEAAARHRQEGQAGLPEGHLADQPRDQRASIRKTITKQIFTKKYANVFKGDANWRKIKRQGRPDLRVGQEVDLRAEPALLRRHGPASRRRSTDIVDARMLGLFLDSITTDHISPAGSIKVDSPGRQVSDRAPGASRPTSTSTARGAAITK